MSGATSQSSHTATPVGRACPVAAETALPSATDHPGTTAFDPPPGPRITAVYPNPTTDGNVGEYFVLETPPATRLDNWTITDGHTTAEFPNVTVSDPVAVTMDPDETAAMTDLAVIELEGYVRLAADGDRLTLQDGDTVVDTISYGRARTATVWHRNASSPDGSSAVQDGSGVGTTDPADGGWWPRGAPCFPVTSYDGSAATAFVLPDSPDVVLERIDSAEDRILVAGYTFVSPDVTDALEAALERGVHVEVLVEAGPVGGTPERTDDLLTRLEAAGAEVDALGGSGARYRYHHPKYAVVDESVLVATENWKPSGLGGTSSRGWSVVVEEPALAADLKAVFRADADGWDVSPWTEHRDTATFVEDDSPMASFPETHEPQELTVDEVELLLAPDNAEGRLVELLEGANESIIIKQASIRGDDLSVLEATVDAAERGVEVRVLLDSSWYLEADNRELVLRLEEWAADDDLPLEARLVDEDDHFGKIHAKGLVVNGETAVVGSINWNENSLRNNREVALVLHGEAAGSYYETVFEADWDGDDDGVVVPLELLGAVGAGLVAAAVLGWHHLTVAGNRETEIPEDERIYFSSRAVPHSRALRRCPRQPSSRRGRR
ncbi:phospholipase D-like domain-containing protein [Natronosalvus vescus]|uniref:phospholipase D-like domain-containing protein n=1 Tax=Natronosalvus vescus TaxID=2953881 RepID=UPI002091A114|nr:phospholipase D-like domain-containing protein [Natronosalvus vescus]